MGIDQKLNMPTANMTIHYQTIIQIAVLTILNFVIDSLAQLNDLADGSLRHTPTIYSLINLST